MIKVKDPKPSRNTAQGILIRQHSADEKRFHELFYSSGNAVCHFYEKATEQQPMHQDYEEWLEEPTPGTANVVAEKGSEECLHVLSFTRYINEKRDLGLVACVRELMWPAMLSIRL